MRWHCGCEPVYSAKNSWTSQTTSRCFYRCLHGVGQMHERLWWMLFLKFYKVCAIERSSLPTRRLYLCNWGKCRPESPIRKPHPKLRKPASATGALLEHPSTKKYPLAQCMVVITAYSIVTYLHTNTTADTHACTTYVNMYGSRIQPSLYYDSTNRQYTTCGHVHLQFCYVTLGYAMLCHVMICHAQLLWYIFFNASLRFGTYIVHIMNRTTFRAFNEVKARPPWAFHELARAVGALGLPMASDVVWLP